LKKIIDTFYPHINSPNNNNQYLKNIDYYLLRKAKQTIFAGIVQDHVEGYTRRRKYFFGDVGDGPSTRCH